MMSMTASARVRSVQKGAAGEFPGQRLARAAGKQRQERRAQHHGGAMALQLGGILSGIAVRGAGNRTKADVQHLVVFIQKRAVDQLAVAVIGNTLPVRRAEHRVHERDGLGPGYAHDADGAHRARRGDSGDGGSFLCHQAKFTVPSSS